MIERIGEGRDRSDPLDESLDLLSTLGFMTAIPPEIEKAAYVEGATDFQVFRKVILPLTLPGISAGAILCFILAMNAYATPVLLGGPQFKMLGPLVYGQFRLNNWPFGAAIAFIVMAATLALTAAANLLVHRRAFRP